MLPVSSCLSHPYQAKGRQQTWALANKGPGMGRVANERPQQEVTCRIFWWHHSHLPRLQNTRRFTQFHPREADSGEIIEPLMIFVIFHEAFMRAILKDSSTERNSLLGKKLVKCTIITQHHLQRDRILWKCTWEASINNLAPTFTCLESGKLSVFLSQTWVTEITVGSNFHWMSNYWQVDNWTLKSVRW